MIGALDEYGYYVFGEDAIARKDYFCPNCDGPMRTRPSPKGLIHFFGRNGAHTEAGCAELTRILEAFDPRKFGFGAKLAQLLRSPGLPPDGPGGGPGGGNNGGNRVPILKLLWVAGLQYASPDMDVEGGKLSDFLIGPRAFNSHLCGAGDIGQRIIVAKPDRPLSGYRIRFCCDCPMDENSKTPDFKKYFVVHFDTAEDFWHYCNQMFDQSKNEKKTMWCPKYEWVMLAGDWHAVGKAECTQTCYQCQHGVNCHGMQYAEIANRNQIYIPDTRKNRIAKK